MFLLLIGIALLAGCSQSVVVETDFPQPMVPSLPLKIGLRYDDALLGYEYREKVPNDVEWSFKLGDANLDLFNTIFASLFAETIRIDDIESAATQYPQLDAIIAPQVEALEFSLPRQSQTDQYSVWIRYNINVYQPTGDLITTWPVSAYGQSDSRTFGGNAAMERATIRAMRDAAATITLGFANQPKIKEAFFSAAGDE